MELRDRVEIGTLFLDQTQPGWRNKIDIIELDISMPGSCVLGQVFGDQVEPEAPWGGYTIGSWKLNDWDDEYLPVDAGFERDGDGNAEAEYEELTRLWVEVIGRP